MRRRDAVRATSGVPLTGISDKRAGFEVRGFVNGLGVPHERAWSLSAGFSGAFTNGSGFVNGTRTKALGPAQRPRPLPRIRRRNGRVQFSLLGAALVLLIPIIYLVSQSESGPRSGIQIDGQASDWKVLGIPFYDDSVPSENPDVSLVRYAHSTSGSRVSFALEVSGTVFGDASGFDGAYFFIDTDGNASTGHQVLGTGADRLLRIRGSANAVTDASLHQWSGSDQHEWAGWGTSVPVIAAARGSFLEAQGFEEDFNLTYDYAVRVALTDFDGNTTTSSVKFGMTAGALLIEQRPLAVTVGGSLSDLLELRFEAFGSTANVVGLTLGPRVPANLSVVMQGVPETVRPGQTAIATVAVDVTNLPQGTFVTVGLAAVLSDRQYTIAGEEGRAYVGRLPSGIVADGVFDDWAQGFLNHDLLRDAQPSSIDITRWAASPSDADFLFYLQVRGTVLAGASIPERLVKTAAGGELVPHPIVARSPVSGEDFIRFYIDIDPISSEGQWAGGILADYFISVSGKEGRVRESSAYSWSGQWDYIGGVRFFQGGDRAEGGVALPVPLPPTALIVIEATTWDGQFDTTDATTTRGTRGSTTPEPAATVPPSWPGFGWRTFDPDEGISDTTLELLEVRADNYWPGGYIYVRFVVEGTSPVLTNNSWWLYLDNGYPNATADGNNDWLVMERPLGSGEVCSYQWDATNSDWGVAGTGCDVSDTLTDTDIGSAVRVVNNCFVGRGCIDFAIEKSDYPGLGQRPYVTLASDAQEDLDLLGDPNRNPSSGGTGCSVAAFDDCTSRVEIPEFAEGPMATALPALLGLVLLRFRRKGRPVRHEWVFPPTGRCPATGTPRRPG